MHNGLIRIKMKMRKQEHRVLHSKAQKKQSQHVLSMYLVSDIVPETLDIFHVILMAIP